MADHDNHDDEVDADDGIHDELEDNNDDAIGGDGNHQENDDDEEDVDRIDVIDNGANHENEAAAIQHLALSFDAMCLRISLNDPQVTSYRQSSSSWTPLNDYQAIRLGIALLDNTHLTELTLDISPTMTDVGANALRDGISTSHVKVLQLNRNDEMPYDMAVLYSDIIHRLESLNLAFPIDDDNLAILEDCLSGNESLKSLFLHDVENMTPHGAQSLANGLCESQLETLDLIGHDDGQDEITREVMKIIYLQGVMGCPTMEGLQLFGMLGSVHDLATALPKLSLLTVSDFEEGLSLADVQVLGDGLRQATHLNVLRLWVGNLGDEHLHILSPALANHPCLEHFDVRVNKVGDDAVAWFVEHWTPNSKIGSLDFTRNSIGAVGAQCLIRASASHPTMRELTLDGNKAIGYDGLHRMGQELRMAGLKLIKLSLHSVTNWVEYDDVTCDKAVQQQAKRDLACQSLLEGVWANVYLQEFSVEGNHLPLHVTAELEVIIKANRNGRIFLSQQHREPPTFWCHFLAQQGDDNDLLYLFLRELPTIVTSSNAAR